MGDIARVAIRLLQRLGRWVAPLLTITLALGASNALAQGPPGLPYQDDGPDFTSPWRGYPPAGVAGPVASPFGVRPELEPRRFDDSSIGESAPAEGFYPQTMPGPAPFETVFRPGYIPPPAEAYPTKPAPEPWMSQWLPDGLIYRSYLAGDKEPRLGGTLVHDINQGWLLEATVGARVAAFRYGTTDPQRPDGWELDCEAAAFPRMATDAERTMISTDFRVGVPLTFGVGPFQTKLAVYHISSHLGDEFMLQNLGFPRINYSRSALVWGNSYFLTEDIRLYAEAEWAFYNDGGSKPWAFQFGAEYSPVQPVGSLRGAPFVAINGHLREEVDFGGNVVVQTGWQWRGQSGHLCRLGMQYVTGPSDQFEFFRRFEDRLGFGIWYDF